MSIEQLACDLAHARQVEAVLLADMEVRQAAFEASIQDLIKRHLDAKICRQALEGAFRNALLEAHAQTGEKKFPGGGVRIVTCLEYKDEDAFFWAQVHSMALALDRKAFEKLAKGGNVSATIVTITEEAQVMIDSDLSPFLKKEGVAT